MLLMSKNILILFICLVILAFVWFKMDSFDKICESFTTIVPEDSTYKVFNNVFSKEECDYIISKANMSLNRSTTQGVGIDSARTSWHTWLNDDDPVIKNFNSKLHNIFVNNSNTKLDYSNTEDLQVVRYLPNQEYKAHYDACHPNQSGITSKMKSACEEELENAGSLRYGTIIVYLNDDFDGGETEFPKINIKIKPEIGKVLMFYSLDEKSNLLDESLHAGVPVKSGKKWICNKWYRLEKYK